MFHRLPISFVILTLALQGVTLAKNNLIQSAEDFAELLPSVQPGDTIIIADGQYDGWSINLDGRGTADHPITIQPQSPNGVTFTGRTHFQITGSYIHMTGFLFDGCDMADISPIEFDRSEYCRVSKSTFQHCEGNRPAVDILPGARNNQVIENRFIDIAGRSVRVRINEDIYDHGILTHNLIQNNQFQDIPPLGGNGRETIKVGTSQPVYGHIKTYTVVEGNTFLRCNGEGEIISNKCSGNTYRGNTFLDCQGELVMRGGAYCLIEGNRFMGCRGGIRLSGTHHTVKDNVIINSTGTGIRLLYGMTKEQGGHYQAVSHCKIIHNTIINAGRAGILIGDGRNRDWQEKGIQNIAPEGNSFQYNLISGSTSDLIIADHAPNNLIENNILRK
ncbi:MAG: polysaccharide lyase 6 family protein [Verrucomicrobia bacterium]|nr:polysaccharide lyase 6 family protein [Verrucomicrobiota bacterium]